jgi:DNA polymerase III sliding clamp (beta) subunit (PCNA family)
LFEVEISRIDPFRNIVKALSVIVEEGTFNLDEAQMKLLAMDPSHVAMVDFELPNAFFDKYKCDGESRLTLNIGEFPSSSTGWIGTSMSSSSWTRRTPG